MFLVSKHTADFVTAAYTSNSCDYCVKMMPRFSVLHEVIQTRFCTPSRYFGQNRQWLLLQPSAKCGANGCCCVLCHWSHRCTHQRWWWRVWVIQLLLGWVPRAPRAPRRMRRRCSPAPGRLAVLIAGQHSCSSSSGPRIKSRTMATWQQRCKVQPIVMGPIAVVECAMASRAGLMALRTGQPVSSKQPPIKVSNFML